MRIGINATFRLHGGGSEHLGNLLRVWLGSGVDRQHELTIFTRTESVASLALPPGSRIQLCPVRFPSLGADLADLRPVWEQTVFTQILRDLNPDVLFCPGSVVPLRSPVPAVVVFRNSAPFTEGVNWRTEGFQRASNFRALGYAMRLSARVATRTIFISQFFRDLFVRRFGFEPEKGDVIYHGRDGVRSTRMDDTLMQRLGLEQPFILSVSHLYPYKNLPALIRGYSSVRHFMKRKGLKLALVGMPCTESYGMKLKRLVHQLDLQDWVLLPGPVSHDQIGPLLGACEFFVFQSLCENCPNTLIEALAAGIPIASSNAGVMPEIAGDAARYFDPLSPADIANSLVRMVEDSSLRAELQGKALVQARKFPTWDEVGQRTLVSLTRAAESNGLRSAAGVEVD